MSRTRRTALLALGAAGQVACGPLIGRTVREGEGLFSDALAGPLLAERDWLADPSLPAIRFADRALYLRSAPTETAYVKARFLPTRAALPLAESEETLEWTCRVQLHGTFFIVLDADLAGAPLRVQVTPYGAHVTAAGAERATRGFETHLPPGWSTAPRTWKVERRGPTAEVRAGSDVLWQGTASGPLTSIAFGETSVDSFHGGELWLSNVRWTRRRATAQATPR